MNWYRQASPLKGIPGRGAPTLARADPTLNNNGHHCRIEEFMNRKLIAPVLIGILAFSSGAVAQESATPAVSSLRASLAALLSRTAIEDVTLTGTAHVIAGSSDDNVPATLKALVDGSARVDLGFSSGTTSEAIIAGTPGPTGNWISSDGKQHALVPHNMMTDTAWFFPAFAISRMATNPAITVVFVDQADSMMHLQAYRKDSGTPPASGPNLQHLTQMDLYLDANTLLPAKLKYNIHPDQNAAIDIPVPVEYSDYKTVNGVLLPHHLQKYLNNSLMQDIQIQTVIFNSGLTDSALSAK